MSYQAIDLTEYLGEAGTRRSTPAKAAKPAKPGPHFSDISRFSRDGDDAAKDRTDWEDWQAYFDERAGIAEFDNGLPRKDAEASATEDCITEWLTRHHHVSDPGTCAQCGIANRNRAAVVPFGTDRYARTWLHPECWQDWYGKRRTEAVEALETMGIAKGAIFPNVLRKNGSE